MHKEFSERVFGNSERVFGKGSSTPVVGQAERASEVGCRMGNGPGVAEGDLKIVYVEHVSRLAKTESPASLGESLGEESDDLLRAILQRELKVDEAIFHGHIRPVGHALGEERLGVHHVEDVGGVDEAGAVGQHGAAHHRAHGHEQLAGRRKVQLLGLGPGLRVHGAEEALEPGGRVELVRPGHERRPLGRREAGLRRVRGGLRRDRLHLGAGRRGERRDGGGRQEQRGEARLPAGRLAHARSGNGHGSLPEPTQRENLANA
mmetsp:Transcript_25582/g.76214  ORF Transcript_25582/g.76214 Transcript_25582/m.76214 type:complete len:262 (+) Transcript_25582:86-871(+)